MMLAYGARNNSTIGGRCRANADGLNGVGGRDEASILRGQAATCRQALNSRVFIVRPAKDRKRPTHILGNSHVAVFRNTALQDLRLLALDANLL